ncbi:uncharacterized protein METZ01_LOCUS118544 [marine metagenome]|uniref:Uncharacterized protein n=1 Tax=marine metagenome TaxID=408172 RepID=A0A381XM54_9ZZZZ
MSWHTAARMPFTLLAATEAPTPLPQIIIPLLLVPVETLSASSLA